MVTEAPLTQQCTGWKNYEKVAFWSFFAYAILTAIPFYPSFYQQDFGSSFSTTDYSWRYLDVLSQNNPSLDWSVEEVLNRENLLNTEAQSTQRRDVSR